LNFRVCQFEFQKGIVVELHQRRVALITYYAVIPPRNAVDCGFEFIHCYADEYAKPLLEFGVRAETRVEASFAEAPGASPRRSPG
jgi:hypothetical protein